MRQSRYDLASHVHRQHHSNGRDHDERDGAANERLRPIDIHTFLALDIPERQMILDPAIPEKGLAMTYASRGIGKTHIACGMTYAVATGTSFLKWNAPRPRRVLHLDGEMAAVELRDRFAQIMDGATVTPETGMLNILTADLIDLGIGNLASLKVQQELEPWLDGVELLTLDNLSTLTAVIRDNDAESWNPIQEWLLRLRRRGVSVHLVHHAGKGGEQRGTSRREDVLDTSISLRRPSDYVAVEGARFEVHFEKARGVHGERVKPFEARLETRDGAISWTTREIEDVNLARVKVLLDDGLSLRDIAHETGLSKSTVGRIKKQIEANAASAADLSAKAKWDNAKAVCPTPKGRDECPKPLNPFGTPVSSGNPGFSSTVPLSPPLGVRDVGQKANGDGDPFASLKTEPFPELPELNPRPQAGEAK
jgi:hypothetical protein